MSVPLASELVLASFDQELRVLTIRIDTGHRANIINKQVLERVSATVGTAIEKYPGIRAVVVMRKLGMDHRRLLGRGIR